MRSTGMSPGGMAKSRRSAAVKSVWETLIPLPIPDSTIARSPVCASAVLAPAAE
jgi:hypothetical protein